ncbi:MAG: AAA family ATPase [Peptococcaceae bacterium]|nr:AAA family ATPase [Peptococcaceae bacterium]
MNRLYIKGFRITTEIDPDSYVAHLPIIRTLRRLGLFSFNSPVTFFVGENGCGKSTLLEALAINSRMNAEGGSRNFTFSTKATESDLHHYLALIKSAHEKDSFFLRAETFYNVATNIADLKLNLDGYGGKSLHDQSHGESFLSLIQNRFRGQGLYILDEPEAALSPTRQMSLLVEIDRLVKENSQFIISTHSPIVMAYPDAEIYEITENTVELTPYTQTEHYQITKQFLKNPQQMLQLLLGSQ